MTLLLAGALDSATVHAQHARNSARYAVAYRDEYQRACAGNDHYLELRGGALFAAGYNANGQLGTGSTGPQATAVQVGSATNWVLVEAGSTFSFGIRADGSLWAWGNNDAGQLGNGNNTEQQAPVQVGQDRWLAVSAGDRHALALRTDGTLWSWGYNNSGQLGQGGTTSVNAPAQVGTAHDWAAISAGDNHSLALKADGSLWSWGENYLGQLGTGSTGFTPTTSPVRIGTDNNWKHIGGGGFFSTAVKADGSLWVWGDDWYGQVTGTEGMPVATPTRVGTTNDWVRTFPGRYHITALKADGSTWAWGKNEGGALGTGNGQPTAPARIPGLNGTVQLTSGQDYSIAVRSNGDLLIWGANNVGVLGIAAGQLTAIPTVAGHTRDLLTTATRHGFVSMVLYTDGTLRGWGYNTEYGLGDGTDEDRYAPVDITAAGNDNISVSVGFGHTLVLKDNGTLWGWGDNDTYGQVGTGSGQQEIVPVQVGTWNDWTSAVAGSHHSTAIRANGTLWAWGPNYDGELGTGDETPHHTPIQVGADKDWVSVIGGASHTIALKADGSIWGWGANYSGDAGGPDGVDPLYAITRIGTDNDWVAINAHTNTSLALKADGTLHGWGAGYSGQIPGNTAAQYGPLAIGDGYVRGELGSWSGVGLRDDGTLRAWGGLNMVFGELGMGDNMNRAEPTPVPGQQNIVHISSGQCHKAAVDATRNDVCMVGRNYNGELGIDSQEGSFNSYQCEVAAANEAVTATGIDVRTVGNVAAEISGTGTLALEAEVLPAAAPQAVTWSVVPVTGAATITAAGVVTGVSTGTVYAKAVVTATPALADSLLIDILPGMGLPSFEQNTFTLFPSPADDRITLRADQLDGPLTVLLIDRTGRVLHSLRTQGDVLRRGFLITVDDLATGAYFLQVQRPDGARSSGMFLKR